MPLSLKIEDVEEGAICIVEVEGGSKWILREGGVVVTASTEDPLVPEKLVEAGRGATLIAEGRDGQRVFLGDSEGYIRCYNATSGELLRNIKAHEGGISCLYATRNVVASAGKEDGLVKLFDAENGLLQQTVEVDVDVSAIVVQEGRIILGSRKGHLLRLKGSGLVELTKFEESEITALCAPSPTSSRIWVGLSTGYVILTKRSTVIFSSCAHEGAVQSMCALSDEFVCSAGRDERVCLWEASKGIPRLLYNGPATGRNVSLSRGREDLHQKQRVWIASETASREWVITSKVSPTGPPKDKNNFSSTPSASRSKVRDVLNYREQLAVQEELSRTKQQLANLDRELERTRDALRHREAEVWSARKTSRYMRRTDREKNASEITDATSAEITAAERELEKELKAALQFIHHMDEVGRNTEALAGHLTTLVKRKCREIMEKLRELERTELSQAERQDLLDDILDIVQALHSRCRDQEDARKLANNSIRQRLAYIEKAKNGGSPQLKGDNKKLTGSMNVGINHQESPDTKSGESIRRTLIVPVRKTPYEVSTRLAPLPASFLTPDTAAHDSASPT